MLKTGIRLDGPEAADNVWLTCCALHNFVLEEDGLAEEWLGSIGQNDVDDFRRYAPFALQRLSDSEIKTFGSREHERLCHEETSREQREMLIDSENVQQMSDYTGPIQYDEDGAIYVNSLTYDSFRSRIEEHFDILFERKRVRWPKQK